MVRYIFRSYLRNFPILTELAAEVAPGAGQREYPRARKEMEQRLLLDRVGVPGGHRVVVERVELSVDVLADLADAELPRANDAPERAQVAADDVIRALLAMPEASDHWLDRLFSHAVA